MTLSRLNMIENPGRYISTSGIEPEPQQEVRRQHVQAQGTLLCAFASRRGPHDATRTACQMRPRR